MDVKIEARTGPNGSIDWTIDGKRPKNSVIEIKRNSPAQDLDFKLDDKTQQEIRFNCDSPFDVHEDDSGACPPAGIHTGEIEILGCSAKKLTVRDKNLKECTLHYQLNLVDRDGKAHVVDPEIRNGGGGGGIV